MSAQKNKKLDLDKREQKKSVVQRFITEEAPVSDSGKHEQESPDTIKGILSPILAAPDEDEPEEESPAYNAQAIETRLEQLENRLSEKLEKLSGPEQKPEQQPAPKYILFNAMEEAVKEEALATMHNVNICKCEKCYHDVCALVLNNMPPQYVTSQEGVLFKKAAALLSIDTLTKLSTEIFDAISKVKDRPGH